jgi:hypothetical protein
MKTIDLEKITKEKLKALDIIIDDDEPIVGEAYIIELDEVTDLIPEGKEEELKGASQLMMAAGGIELEDESYNEIFIIYEYDNKPYYIIMIDEEDNKQCCIIQEDRWLEL